MSTATQFMFPLGPGYTLTQDHNDFYAGVGYHLGEDWANGTTGGSVMAAANGVVVYAGFHTNSNGSPGFGNLGHLDFYPFSAQHLGVSGSKLAVDC